MLNLNKHTKTEHKSTFIFKNCSSVCAYHWVQVSYTRQHRTVLIIFALILQTIITAHMLSTGGEGNQSNWWTMGRFSQNTPKKRERMRPAWRSRWWCTRLVNLPTRTRSTQRWPSSLLQRCLELSNPHHHHHHHHSHHHHHWRHCSHHLQHRVSSTYTVRQKQGATLTTAITMTILDGFEKFFHCCSKEQ